VIPPFKILWVETGTPRPPSWLTQDRGLQLDYRVYGGLRHGWRRIEEKLRLDLYLSWRAKQVEQQYDLVWAGSEKVGIPLALLNPRRPLVVVAHHPESPAKTRLFRTTSLASRWSAVGYVSEQSRTFLLERLGVPADRLFQYSSARHLHRVQPGPASTGPLLSVGVTKRDYATLLAAVSSLPGYETEIFASSRFGELLAKPIDRQVPEWIRCAPFVPEAELWRHYRNTRFVVVTLEPTTHGGAGLSAALEAGTFAKAVIATRTGGMSTFVKDGETGILVPPNDVEALRSAIQKLWENPALAQRMGEAGRRYLERNFDPEKVRANIHAMLGRVVETSP
jgi:glycosyltransferase involved in cell wall biosynthesis